MPDLKNGGRWTDLYDTNSGRWLRVYLDLPKPVRTGAVSTLPVERPVLFGPDGKPIAPPERPLGFRP